MCLACRWVVTQRYVICTTAVELCFAVQSDPGCPDSGLHRTGVPLAQAKHAHSHVQEAPSVAPLVSYLFAGLTGSDGVFVVCFMAGWLS